MNSNHEDERLDALLGQWSEQSAAPQRVDDVHDRIVNALVDADHGEPAVSVSSVSLPGLNGHAKEQAGSSSDRVTLPYPRQRGWRPGHWAAGFAVGSAVMLLISVTVFWFASQDRNAIGPASDLPPEYAWLRDEQIQNKEVLLAEMENMFDRQLAWVAETGDRIEFGLDQSSDAGAELPPASETARLAVRVVVERRSPGSTDWELAWALDVVSRSEEVVRVAPRNADGNELRLWSYQLPDGLIAVDSELQLAGRDGFHATTSGLQQDRQPVQVLTTRDKGTEYRVFQTVAVLDGKVS